MACVDFVCLNCSVMRLCSKSVAGASVKHIISVHICRIGISRLILGRLWETQKCGGLAELGLFTVTQTVSYTQVCVQDIEA